MDLREVEEIQTKLNLIAKIEILKKKLKLSLCISRTIILSMQSSRSVHLTRPLKNSKKKEKKSGLNCKKKKEKKIFFFKQYEKTWLRFFKKYD